MSRESLLARVASLSEEQRRALSARLSPSSGGAQRLVAFVALEEPERALDEAALRDFLAARLPDYLLPSRFVVVDRLPRTAAGKLDRRALPNMSGKDLFSPSARPLHDGGTPSRMSETEVKLVAIWRDVLKVDDVGLDDDFFEIGGDSLLSIRVISRAGRDGIRIAPERFFERPTIRHMAASAAVPAVASRTGSLVRFRSSGTGPTVYTIPGMDGSLFGLPGLARALGLDTQFAAFESPGLDGREAPLDSIEAIAERYVSELIAEPEAGFHLLGICWGAAVAFEMSHRLRARGRAPMTLSLMDPVVLLREVDAQATSSDVSFVRNRLEMYWDEFRAGNWRDRTRLIATKAKRAAHLLAGGAEGEQSQAERHQHRVREANRFAITRYVPGAHVLPATTLFLTTDRDFDGRVDHRLEWTTVVTPPPRIIRIRGVDTGDAISPANVAGFATALRQWFMSADGD